MNWKVIIFTELYIGKPYQYLGYDYIFEFNHDTDQSKVSIQITMYMMNIMAEYHSFEIKQQSFDKNT
jgi:hypothetical protein